MAASPLYFSGYVLYDGGAVWAVGYGIEPRWPSRSVLMVILERHRLQS